MQEKSEQEKTRKALLREFAKRRCVSRRKGVFEDIRKTVMEARPYRLWITLLAYFRRARTVTLILRITGWLLTLLQTGALVILTTLVFFILLPIVLLGSVVVFLIALSDTRRCLRRMQAYIGERRVFVFFSPLGEFGASHAKSMASASSVVLVVSPHWISPSCLGNSSFYINVRRDGEHLFVIRRYFFFSVRKKILKSDQTVWIF